MIFSDKQSFKVLCKFPEIQYRLFTLLINFLTDKFAKKVFFCKKYFLLRSIFEKIRFFIKVFLNFLFESSSK